MGKRKLAKRASDRSQGARSDTVMRVIGGSFRGRKLHYHGDPRTRPMKDRVREAIFNLLGPAIKGKHALDLFAGTGAIGYEALSRGAITATFIERHFPTARLIEVNARELACEDRCSLFAADTFIWVDQNIATLPETPWVVFCSPPYDLFIDQANDLVHLLQRLYEQAPSSSQFIVESDKRFDATAALAFAEWDVRTYSPAVVAITEKA